MVERVSDEELIQKYRNGDADACECIMERYKNLVRKKAKAMYIAGGDSDDLIQEGMIGLYKAVCSFQENQEANFMTFASMCINRQLCTAVTASNRNKHKPLNSYVSFYAPVEGKEESGITLSDVLESPTDQDPEKIYIDQERTLDVRNQLDQSLSEMERDVLALYLNGLGYVEIAAKLGKTPKSIDNAIQRIKSKLSHLL